MNITAYVFARANSRRLPGKNLRLLAGRPLLAHAIEAAQGARLVTRVVVSTDDEEIAALARGCGAEVEPQLGGGLVPDDNPEWRSWQWAVRHARPPLDVFVSVPCTAPLRLPSDIDAVIEALLTAPDAGAVLTVTPARRNPWYNMVTVNRHTGWAYVAASDRPAVYHNSQEAPEVYDCTTVAYAARPRYILEAPALLMPGRVRAVVVPPERAVDIDTELDLRIAEMLMAEREKREVAC